MEAPSLKVDVSTDWLAQLQPNMFVAASRGRGAKGSALRQTNRLAAVLRVQLADGRVRMQRVAMTAKRADVESLSIQLGFELLQVPRALQQRKLDVRVAGEVAGAKLDGVDIERPQLLQHLL